MKESFKKNSWRFFVAFVIGLTLSSYGMSIWETMSIIFLIAIIVESIIYYKTKKKK